MHRVRIGSVDVCYAYSWSHPKPNSPGYGVPEPGAGVGRHDHGRTRLQLPLRQSLTQHLLDTSIVAAPRRADAVHDVRR